MSMSVCQQLNLAKQLRIDLNQRGLEGIPSTVLMGFCSRLVRAVAFRPVKCI